MDFEHRLAISNYKTIAVLQEAHQTYVVQHQETKKIYVKKVLDVFNADIYHHLSSNHIIGTPKIIDYIEEDQKLIVIEEFISGTSLSEKIEAKQLSSSDIVSYMFDLCNILEQLHAQKPAIIHRDVKPANIIISNYNRAILLDFNAAKFYSSEATEDTILLGTQGYAAPEQYGFGASSPQTDIYALGVLLKEMVSSVSFSIPELDAVIQKCTQMNPAERYHSISELRSHICSITNTEKQPVSFSKRHPYLPPGFRTKTPWKMMLASICYLFITWLCFSLEVKDTYGLALWTERLFLYAMFLFIPFASFNYLDVQKLMPLCKHKNRLVRYFGILLLDVIVILGLFVLMMIIIS